MLVATPSMQDDCFRNTVIYLVAHSAEGAMGVVINRPVGNLTLGGLLERLGIGRQTELADIVVHKGGPVEPERGFVLHSADYKQRSTLLCPPSVGLTTTLEIVKDIACGRGPKRFLFALGHAGWAGGQLEEEIRRSGWFNVRASTEMIFSSDWRQKWNHALRLLGLDAAKFSATSGSA